MREAPKRCAACLRDRAGTGTGPSRIGADPIALRGGAQWDNPEVTFEEVDCSGWYDQVNASAPYQMELGDTTSTSGPSWTPSTHDTEPMTKCSAYASLTCEAGEEQVFVRD